MSRRKTNRVALHDIILRRISPCTSNSTQHGICPKSDASCCNDADCYPTVIKYVDGKIYAKRREDGKYIPIPPEKVESERDNPDGRNHLCAPPPNALHPSATVFCFALGGAT